jgi:hypothetical protein
MNIESLQNKAKERTVRTQNIEYDLETLVKKISKGVIKLNPEYQRKHRWEDDVSSRLIESLILNIPVPLIYISQDIDVDDEIEDGIARYSVIDGQQRLTAISNFFSNKYALTGLTVLEELNDLHYKDLPPFLIRRLEERTLRCLRIDSTVDTQVKYDIFERLNSGSIKLEPQELRNAVCRGKFNDLTKELAQNDIYRELINLTESREKKMYDQELILRYFAIAHNDGYKSYKGSFKNFLTERMIHFNSLDSSELDEMKSSFTNIIVRINEDFGTNPFSKFRFKDDAFERMSKFNAAVYDSVMYMYSNPAPGINLDYDQFMNLFKDESFFDAIEGSILDVSKLSYRLKAAKELR